MTRRRLGDVCVFSACSILTLLAGCSAQITPVREPAAQTNVQESVQDARVAAAMVKPLPTAVAPAEFPGLHQVVAYTDSLYSGGAPEGEEAFASLAAMGFKTIISVDGAKPNVALAEKYGLKYIHLPIGYNGFDETRRRELARATQDSMKQGSVYMHCHHGKHRSAGALGTTVVSLGLASNESMLARMKVSGCADGYKGLWARTREADVLSPQQLAAVNANFPSVSPPGTFVESMVDIDLAAEHLAEIQKAGWQTPADHPDLVPAAEAGRAADILRLLAAKASERKKDEFSSLMAANADAAQTLEDMIIAGKSKTELDGQLKIVMKSCKDCHVKYRD
jgi:protein tyrosine phosphatase (PTP) superfamily phosphohydrolase (DUF442 family)